MSSSWLDRFKRVYLFIGWPIIVGLLVANLYLDHIKPADIKPTAIRSYADAVQKATPSVVTIYTWSVVPAIAAPIDDPFLHYFNPPTAEKKIPNSLGSGVIVSTEGYLLTNLHVIKGADVIMVLTDDNRESAAKVIGIDAEIDLAVLKIDLPGLIAISPGDIDEARIGDVVLAIGNPYNIGKTVTQGIISASSHQGLRVSTNYIQTDAAINPGNSGGALIDTEGRLLGINTSIYSKTGASDGIGFALPVDTAMKALHDIIHYGHVIRGALGIVPKPVPSVLSQKLGIKPGYGLLITAIYRNGPAHKAGLMPGDVIVQLDGHLVTGDEAGLDTIATTTPGKQTTVIILRHGKTLTKNIVPSVRAE